MMIAKYKKASEVHCIVQNEGMLSLAKKKKQKQNLSSMHTYLEDATHTHFSKELFDYVIISLVLYEMNNTLADTLLKEAYTLL